MKFTMLMRSFSFPNGSQVTLPVRACESSEEAKKLGASEAADMKLLLDSHLMTITGPGQVSPVGLTVREFLKKIGVSEINHGSYEIETHGAIVAPAAKKLITLQ